MSRVGLREEAREGRRLARRIARLFPPRPEPSPAAGEVRAAAERWRASTAAG